MTSNGYFKFSEIPSKYSLVSKSFDLMSIKNIKYGNFDVTDVKMRRPMVYKIGKYRKHLFNFIKFLLIYVRYAPILF